MDLQTRNQYMKAMGIPVWMPRVPAADQAQPLTQTPPVPAIATAAVIETVTAPQAASIALPVAALATPAADKANTTEPAIPVSIAPDCSTLNWAQLQQTVADCQLCSLHKSRTQTVFGSGDTQADWMIIGEAPGAEEDHQGEPFVGRAGKLLSNMLAAVGLPRNAVYISNVLKCRPPNNRDPKADESALCRGYLERQIALVNPALIIVVGRIAAHNLLQTTTPLGRLRGTVHTLPGSDIQVIVTYHPAYLLRQPAEKRKAWQDLQLARQTMAGR